MYSVQGEDEDGEESDFDDEGDEYYQEEANDDDVFDPPEQIKQSLINASGASTSKLQDIAVSAEGSESPPSSNKNLKQRGRKPKQNFGTGLAKDSNEYQKLRKENHVCLFHCLCVLKYLLTVIVRLEKCREEAQRDYQRRNQASI